MKKIIIFFILTAYLLPQASAQQVKFGVEAGGNWSHYKNDNPIIYFNAPITQK